MGHDHRGLGIHDLGRRLRDGWIDAVLVHHKLVLVLGALLTVVAVGLAARLELNSDLRRLLPRDDFVVQKIERIEGAFGALGTVDVVVHGGTPVARHAFADAVAEQLRGHEMLSKVDHRPELEFFRERALYYIDDAAMEELEERVMAAEHFAMCSNAPDVCVEKPDPKAGEKLRAFVDEHQAEAQGRVGFDEYYEREGTPALIVFLHPIRPANDLAFDIALTDEMHVRIDEVLAREGPWQGTGLHYNLIGPYVAKAEEQRAVPGDIARSGAVGIAGVMAILFWLFRSVRAMLTLLTPLLAGVAWSMGATQVFLGHLNSMTSLISTVVLGMGIDAGIHLLSRIRKERQGHDDLEAIRRGFQALMVPLLVASSTTVGAFVVMTTSAFPAFREFGVIGACGVALCLLAMATVFPAILLVVGVPPARARVARGSQPLYRFLLERPAAAGGLLLLLTGGCWFGIQNVRDHGFEYNGRVLGSDRVRDMVEADSELVREILAKDIHPSVTLVADEDALRRDHQRAIARQAELAAQGESVVAEVLSALSFMPATEIDLTQRKQALDELTENFSDKTWDRIEGKSPGGADGDAATGDEPGAMTDEEARAIRKMFDAKPFGLHDLPASVLDRVRAKDGQWGIFAYPTFDRGQMLLAVQLMEETATYAEPPEPYVGEAAVFAAMYQTMGREWSGVLTLAAVVVTILVFAQLLSLRQTLMTVVPLAVGVVWLLGVMGTADVRFTLFNVPVFPAILGIGVDHGVYLTVAIASARRMGRDVAETADSTGRAILAASGTTAVGFGSFMVADSGGLRSIGEVAVIGIVLSALAALLVLPTLAGLFGSARRS